VVDHDKYRPATEDGKAVHRAKGDRCSSQQTTKVCEMQTAEIVLTAIRKQGEQHQPLTRVYRQLFNRDMYLLAYGKISRNQGATTPGVTKETVDGMSLSRIDSIIEEMRNERYRWTPTRRVYIEKANSTKKRPLGIPTWGDKLVQEVLRLILEAYYEPQFSDYSHGFRPSRGCDTALSEIYHNWKGTVWFIEGDIRGCFDNIDHTVLLSILAKSIHDGRFLRLIAGALEAGYMEDWTYKPTLSGTPQGGIISPILANIYLDQLDKYVTQTLTPTYNRNERRRPNPTYRNITHRLARARCKGRIEDVKTLKAVQRTMPSVDTHDPSYRRLRYIRYADDFLLGFAGPKQEAEDIKHALKGFLAENLHLELSEEKTAITHARTKCARFLGYDLKTLHDDNRFTFSEGLGPRRTLNAVIGLRVPPAVIKEKYQRYERNGKPIHRAELLNNSVFDIIALYQAEYRGFVNYYRKAYNLSQQCARLKWVMQESLAKTLAHKLKISVAQVYQRYRTQVETPHGMQVALQVRVDRPGKEPLTATWGGVTLRWDSRAKITEPPNVTSWIGRSELIDRLLAEECELCGSSGPVQVHHIRHLKDLRKPGRTDKPLWVQIMAARKRKTLVVCQACHTAIHTGQPQKRNEHWRAG